MRFKKFGYIGLLIIILGVYSSCKKDQQSIPITGVNIKINLSLPEFQALNAVGNAVEIGGGSRGIIVYRKSNTEYKAYDKHCPYNVNDPCGIVETNNTITATDPCCGSEFLLSDGSVLTGPASLPLTEYSTSLEGNFLYIFN